MKHESHLANAPVVVLPAYEPDQVLVHTVRQLAESRSFNAVIVVDDGSGPHRRRLFDEVERIEKVHLLRHAHNLGKGAALKTGFNYAAVTFPRSVGIVTVDADGQHDLHDILRVAESLARHPECLVLGARAFDTGVPLRSRFGNVVTRHVMKLVMGEKITDTQTGLRGIPLDMIPELLRLHSNRYEFELDMLLCCRRLGRSIIQIGIKTIYLDDNRSSHFHPLVDSMRIYFLLLRFTGASVVTAILDNIVFALAFMVWQHILGCQVIGRIAGTLFQYIANKRVVFQSPARHSHAAPKYFTLVVVSGVISYSLILLIHRRTGIGVIPSKIIAETIVFFFNFVIQRDFIFPKRPVCGW